ncbi:hypothetical protein AVEN_266337-1 [Araneus ventricosus]|uniref:Uncharacterized protein n=1 Tax=Araneus ventricosus TaxID=182803 RepID=A0A4Y2L176_ARAVE|nr:hypothetical protein AVEN_266337-1 [Araneus ventricosus]
MTRTTPELARPSPNVNATDIWPLTYDLTCNRPNTRRIFSGTVFRTCNPPPKRRDLTTRPQRPRMAFGIAKLLTSSTFITFQNAANMDICYI